MSFISEATRESWQKLADDLALNRPSVGKRVQVVRGKHNEKVGEVFWHGPDKFSDAYRYASDAQAHLRDMEGRRGWRVGVRTEGGEKFFVSAEYVDVIQAE